ncbi:hypothetical protein ACLVWU_10325 [Bdellovibrio sp. HCB290]|uniref:hypothetical protein n=1 Tax=Bdellovibrio sp. HCB290 TaxID=3394356 RepID=UPI0039B48ABD
MKSVFIASLIALSATAAQAATLDVHCTSGDAVVTAELNIDGKAITGNINADGSGIEDFKATATGNYIFYPAGSYYKFDDLEVIEFWGVSGKDSVGYKSVKGEQGAFTQTLVINKQAVQGTCVITKN